MCVCELERDDDFSFVVVRGTWSEVSLGLLTQKNLHAHAATVSVRRITSHTRRDAPTTNRRFVSIVTRMWPLSMSHRVISSPETQNGAQKCTKVVRDAPLRGARGHFPLFLLLFFYKPPLLRHETVSLSLSFSSLVGRFTCLYKLKTSIQIARSAHSHTITLPRTSGDK